MNIHTNSGGRFTTAPDATDFKTALDKARLARILAADIDPAGNWNVPPEDQIWALEVTRIRPMWAESTLAAAGIR